MAVTTHIDPFVRRLIGSVVSAVVIAALALTTTTLLLFTALLVGANSPEGALQSLAGVFAWGTFIVFLVMTLMALVGAYSRWYLTVLAGVLAAILGGLIGNLLRLVIAHSAVTGASIFEPMATSYLPFEVLTVVGSVTAGAVVFRRILSSGSVRSERRIALVRAPAANLADGEVTHIARTALDGVLADSQWDAYVAALTENGWEIVEVPIADGMADSVFITDAIVVFGDTAVITSPGAVSRRGETVAAEATAREVGLKVVTIDLPGTLDGGDVLTVGTTVYVGRGGRTNADGIRQLRNLIAPFGFSVVAVPMTKALHLTSAVTALPDGTVVGWPPVVDDPALFERFLEMPEESGAHVVVLDHDTVLMAASAPMSTALISDLGYRVVTVDISEFEKLEGGVTCLSVRVR